MVNCTPQDRPVTQRIMILGLAMLALAGGGLSSLTIAGDPTLNELPALVVDIRSCAVGPIRIGMEYAAVKEILGNPSSVVGATASDSDQNVHSEYAQYGIGLTVLDGHVVRIIVTIETPGAEEPGARKLKLPFEAGSDIPTAVSHLGVAHRETIADGEIITLHYDNAGCTSALTFVPPNPKRQECGYKFYGLVFVIDPARKERQ